MSLMKNYTVFYDEDAELWIVRRHGSKKKSDALPTQTEAIERAKELANKTGGTVNIKNKDGKVRAQALKSNKEK